MIDRAHVWRRSLQGIALIAGMAALQGQGGCQARSRTTDAAPPSSPQTPGTPPPQPPPTPETTVVTGNEKIAWAQEVTAGTRVGSMSFAAYVDGLRVDFPGVSCIARSETFHECTAPLPQMALGAHTLRLAAVGPSDNPLFSPRSRVLTLIKVESGSAAVASSAAAAAGDAAKKGEPFSIDILSDSNGPIADIAVSADGLVFAAEVGGRILTIGSSGVVEAFQVPDLARRGGPGLVSIALHPDFANNRRVYFAYVGDSPAGPVWRVARGREVNGRIGEVAVLMDREPALPGSSGVIRFGPDRDLYVALGSNPPQPVRSGAYSGRLLRFNDDGGRATSSKEGSPVVGTVNGAPAGLAFVPPDLRLLQTRNGDRYEFSIAQGANVLSRLPWEFGRRPAGLAYSAANGGWLYIATLDRGLQRVKWPPPKGTTAQTAATIAAEYTGVRAVAVAADGTIFFGTANSSDDRPRPGAPGSKNYVIRAIPR